MEKTESVFPKAGPVLGFCMMGTSEDIWHLSPAVPPYLLSINTVWYSRKPISYDVAAPSPDYVCS